MENGRGQKNETRSVVLEVVLENIQAGAGGG
jgi:hypothetical protein